MLVVHHRRFGFGQIDACSRRSCTPGSRKNAANGNAHVGLFQGDQGRRDLIDDVMLVDQSPIGRTPRSNPVTYIKAYDAIREAFRRDDRRKSKGLQLLAFFVQRARRPLRDLPGQRHRHGRNAVSRRRRTDLRRLPRNAFSSDEMLDVKYKGKNIHDVLQMTVREAILFFKDVEKLVTS